MFHGNQIIYEFSRFLIDRQNKLVLTILFFTNGKIIVCHTVSTFLLVPSLKSAPILTDLHLPKQNYITNQNLEEKKGKKKIIFRQINNRIVIGYNLSIPLMLYNANGLGNKIARKNDIAAQSKKNFKQ